MRITGKADGIEVASDTLTTFLAPHTVFNFQNGLIYQEDRESLAPIQDFLSCLSELPGTVFYIYRNDIPAFCRELFPLLKKHYTCDRIHFNEADYSVQPASFSIYLDGTQ